MKTAVIIVCFRTPDDIADCLHALKRLQDCGQYTVFIVENGGPAAFEALVRTASLACGGPPLDVGCGDPNFVRPSRHVRTVRLTLLNSKVSVMLAEARGNLGYAGGVNSWLELMADDYDGYWILNPDTSPDPHALSAMIAACFDQDCWMVGSAIVDFDKHHRIMSRGLRWLPWTASVIAVDQNADSGRPEQPKIDAPSGTSFYLTRSCLQAIGLMHEGYFLYYEDLEWGLRAKAAGRLCVANGSLTLHKYGSSLGSAKRRAERSQLSVYLDTRNLIRFTLRNNPRYVPLALLRAFVRVVEYAAFGSIRNAAAAFGGLWAALHGECGQPPWHARSSRQASPTGTVHELRREDPEYLPFVSVVIPHYNDLEALRLVVRSIEAQSYPRDRFEIVVADNNSSCGILAVKAAAPSAKVVLATVQGAGPARNAGVRQASGEVLAFIDSDCVAAADWMRNGVASLDAFHFSGGSVVTTGRNPAALTSIEAFEIVFAFDFKRYIEKRGFTGTGNMFVRRVVFDAVGPFRNGLSEDIEWSWRARAAGYQLGFVAAASVRHPARHTWDALHGRWRRMLREQFLLARERRSGCVKWALAALLMPVSIVPHALRIARSKRLPHRRDRFAAIQTLVRLRLWRTVEMLRLLVRERGTDAHTAIARPSGTGSPTETVAHLNDALAGLTRQDCV